VQDTLSRLNQLFREVFDDDGLTVTRETRAGDIEDWDSHAHVTLLLSVEKAFGVKFTTREIAQLQDVGQLLDLLEQRPSTARP
jgi:acyl carrier protein